MSGPAATITSFLNHLSVDIILNKVNEVYEDEDKSGLPSTVRGTGSCAAAESAFDGTWSFAEDFPALAVLHVLRACSL